MNVLNPPQGSDEWKMQRLGKATASRIADIIAQTKSGPSASRKNYMAQLVVERLTGEVAESFSNAAMQWGTETEPQARAAYSFLKGAEVEEAPFVVHPSIPDAGASPDGLVGSDGLIEIKCPQSSTHIDTILTGKIDGKYITQIMWQLACTGRAFCDFVSYDPRMPEHLAIWVKRVPRDDAMIEELEGAVRVFLAEVASTVAALEAYAEAA
jgi:putative phage-type endonuclease